MHIISGRDMILFALYRMICNNINGNNSNRIASLFLLTFYTEKMIY